MVQINGNLYRHTTGAGLAVHSGFVLITKEGALVIDPAMTCTATWLRDEIKHRFNVSVRYVIYTHAHADHISGGQVFQKDFVSLTRTMTATAQRGITSIEVKQLTVLQGRAFEQGRYTNDYMIAAWGGSAECARTGLLCRSCCGRVMSRADYSARICGCDRFGA